MGLSEAVNMLMYTTKANILEDLLALLKVIFLILFSSVAYASLPVTSSTNIWKARIQVASVSKIWSPGIDIYT